MGRFWVVLSAVLEGENRLKPFVLSGFVKINVFEKIIPASDPNGRFVTSLDFLGFSSARTSRAFRLLGLQELFVCEDFLGFSSVRTSRASVRQDFWGFSSFRTSWASRLLELLGLFVC